MSIGLRADSGGAKGYITINGVEVVEVTSAGIVGVGEGGGSPLTTLSISTNTTLTTDQCYNYVVYVTASCTLTLPAIVDGMNLTVIADGTVVVTIDPNGTEIIRKDAADVVAGGTITSTGNPGDVAALTYRSAGKWYASTNGW